MVRRHFGASRFLSSESPSRAVAVSIVSSSIDPEQRTMKTMNSPVSFTPVRYWRRSILGMGTGAKSSVGRFFFSPRSVASASFIAPVCCSMSNSSRWRLLSFNWS